MDEQKQVLEAVVHCTATIRAALRRARKSSSVNGLPRKTRSCMPRAAISQARTPRNASCGATVLGCSKPKLPERCAVAMGRVGGKVKRFQGVGPTV